MALVLHHLIRDNSFTYLSAIATDSVQKMLPELTEQILKYLDQHGNVDTLDLAAHFNVDHQKIVGALKSIEATGDLVHSEPASRKAWELTDEGKEVCATGSHEAVVFYAIPDDGIAQTDLMKVL